MIEKLTSQLLHRVRENKVYMKDKATKNLVALSFI